MPSRRAPSWLWGLQRGLDMHGMVRLPVKRDSDQDMLRCKCMRNNRKQTRRNTILHTCPAVYRRLVMHRLVRLPAGRNPGQDVFGCKRMRDRKRQTGGKPALHLRAACWRWNFWFPCTKSCRRYRHSGGNNCNPRKPLLLEVLEMIFLAAFASYLIIILVKYCINCQI